MSSDASPNTRPNLLFVFADQLGARWVPLYGNRQIEMPNLERLARNGVTFDNAISTCPLCTPYRSMLLTGRYPQTTGHVVNFVRTRHDEISIGDAFAHAGYRTGWVGKWHLHSGAFPMVEQPGPDYVPEGRDRLGFEFWRGYNFRTEYVNGWINRDDWDSERWEGYETDALPGYAREFLDDVADDPFCLFVSCHQPHHTINPPLALPEHYARVPEHIDLLENTSEEWTEEAREMLRDYLAMTIAVDDMLGKLLDELDERGLADNTLVVFTSDHGCQYGAHGVHPWIKRVLYEESIHIPLIARLPGTLDGGRRCDAITAPVDFFHTFCSLCHVEAPSTIEGLDLSKVWRGMPAAPEREDVLTYAFSLHPDRARGYSERPDVPKYKRAQRGVRTKTHSYFKWVDGTEVLTDLQTDPFQMNNLVDDPAAAPLLNTMRNRLSELLAERCDALQEGSAYRTWFDEQRRVVRNAFGPLPHPESHPDWSKLGS